MANQMVLEGVIRLILPVQSGESNGRPWQRGGFVVDVQDGSYTNQVCFEQWANNLPLIEGFNVGDRVVVNYNIRSREYQGRWYTSVSAWRIQRADEASQPMVDPEPFPPVGRPMQSLESNGPSLSAGKSIEDQLDNLPF